MEQNGHAKNRRLRARRIPITAPRAQSRTKSEIPVKNNPLARVESGEMEAMNMARNNNGPRAQILIHSLKDGVITIP